MVSIWPAPVIAGMHVWYHTWYQPCWQSSKGYKDQERAHDDQTEKGRHAIVGDEWHVNRPINSSWQFSSHRQKTWTESVLLNELVSASLEQSACYESWCKLQKQSTHFSHVQEGCFLDSSLHVWLHFSFIIHSFPKSLCFYSSDQGLCLTLTPTLFNRSTPCWLKQSCIELNLDIFSLDRKLNFMYTSINLRDIDLTIDKQASKALYPQPLNPGTWNGRQSGMAWLSY